MQDSWSSGMKPDTPREKILRSGAYSLTDAFLDLGAPIVKRGGWDRPWNQIGSSGYAQAVGFAPFVAGHKVIGITSGGTLYSMAYGSATTTSVGACNQLAHPPVYYSDKLWFPDINGSAALKSWDGTTLATASGSPPAGAICGTWRDHLVLARSAANPRRIWFAGVSDPTDWVTTDPGGQWMDALRPVQGLAEIKGMLLIFEEGLVERIRGTVIPGVTGSDATIEYLFSVGCSDPASIAVSDDYVVWANSSGVYFSDGSTMADLTLQAGISQEWKTNLSGYASTWTIAAAIYRGMYVCTVMDGSTFKCAYWIDIPKRAAGRLTNIKATMLCSTPVGLLDLAPKLIMGERGDYRVSDLTTMWTPSSTYKNDDDGTAVTWSMETPFYLGKRGLKRLRNLLVTYAMQDAGTDNPTLTVQGTTDLSVGAYTTLDSAVPETTTGVWDCYTVGMDEIERSEGVGVKISQTGPSAFTKLYSIEMEWNPMEQSRR
jgi:hypothetical protein